MTDEQIANLKADKGEDGDTGEMSYLVRPADLERLLEERKKLLAAAKLGEYYGAVVDGAGKAESTEIYAIAEAIFYAEEEAK